MPNQLPKLTQQEVDDLKARCQECKAILEGAGGGGFAATGPIDTQEVVKAIGDGTIWQLILRYGPRVFAFLMEILEQYVPQPNP